jgi:hypothetical protein
VLEDLVDHSHEAHPEVGREARPDGHGGGRRGDLPVGVLRDGVHDGGPAGRGLDSGQRLSGHPRQVVVGVHPGLGWVLGGAGGAGHAASDPLHRVGGEPGEHVTQHPLAPRGQPGRQRPVLTYLAQGRFQLVLTSRHHRRAIVLVLRADHDAGQRQHDDGPVQCARLQAGRGGGDHHGVGRPDGLDSAPAPHHLHVGTEVGEQVGLVLGVNLDSQPAPLPGRRVDDHPEHGGRVGHRHEATAASSRQVEQIERLFLLTAFPRGGTSRQLLELDRPGRHDALRRRSGRHQLSTGPLAPHQVLVVHEAGLPRFPGGQTVLDPDPPGAGHRSAGQHGGPLGGAARVAAGDDDPGPPLFRQLGPEHRLAGGGAPGCHRGGGELCLQQGGAFAEQRRRLCVEDPEQGFARSPDLRLLPRRSQERATGDEVIQQVHVATPLPDHAGHLGRGGHEGRLHAGPGAQAEGDGYQDAGQVGEVLGEEHAVPLGWAQPVAPGGRPQRTPEGG